MTKYPQFFTSIVLALLFFLISRASYGSNIIGLNPLNGLVNQWWKILLVGSQYNNTPSTPVFFSAEDLDSDNDGIPNSIEDQECLSLGLNYEFYDGIPTGPSTDNIPTSGALASGIVQDFDVKSLQGAVDPGDTAHYSIRYSGLIYIASSGNYTFSLFSDDGSQIFIDNTLVVDSDKKYLSGHSPIQGSKVLTKGFHPFTLLYFDSGGNQFLNVEYQGPGIENQSIPAHLFSTGKAVSNTIPNGDFESDLFNGDWVVTPASGSNGWENESSTQFGRAHLPSTSLNTLASLTAVVGVNANTDSSLSFDLGTRASNSDNDATLKVYINNILRATYTSDQILTLAGGDTEINNPTLNMATQSISFNVPNSSVIIKITAQGSVSSGFHDRLFIDNVAVSPLASCNDQDGDGIVNSLDLDSDNDGIYDAEEAGHGAAHINGVVSGAVGADGIPDAVQTGSDLNYTILDTDGDNVPNFLDTDSDGDNCPDVKEAGFTESSVTSGELNGTAIDSNGRITGNSDGFTTPSDSDANGTKDYLESGSIAVISSQPNALETCVGKSFSLSVNANTAYQYQWQYLSDSTWINLSNSSNISGANTSQLIISSAKMEQLKVQYRVQVLDGSFLCGSKVNSNEVLVGTQHCTAITNRRITYRAKNNF